MRQENRKTYLDAVRVLAGLLVIYNHVAGQDMRLFSGAAGAVALFLLYLSKSAIPLFLIVTGATLLNREESYGKVFLRIGRITLVLTLATLFYYGAQCVAEGAPFVLTELLDILYHSQASNSLWYLYAYIGLLVMLPILQRMSAAFGRNEYLYFAFWTLLFNGFMPVLQCISTLFVYDSSFVLPVFTGMIGMAVLGRGVDVYGRFSTWRTVVSIVLPLIATAAMTYATMLDNTLFGVFDNAFLLPSMGTALALTYLIRAMQARRAPSERACGVLSHLARLIFCTYLLADFMIEKLQFVREALVPALRVNGAGVAYTGIVFIACLLVAECLTRIPGLKRLI